jgi:3-dehydroquinate synthase
MIEIPVELGDRRYPILVGRGLAPILPDLLEWLDGRRIVVVSSPRVWAKHGARLVWARRASAKAEPILVPDGERHKNRAMLATIHDRFLDAGLRRDGVVIAVGGGVIGDVTGFAAATYMRGVSWVVVPTTLLSMVDSAIGGKVGINHPKAKNMIGAFHQPKAVVSDPAFLETLPIREVRGGAYEILKCGLLADRSLFEAMQQAPLGLRGWRGIEVESAIASASKIKAEIVEKDEREGGLRRVLNLGHTLGHALEAVTHYRRFTHGEAVGWGLLGAADIARRRGLLKEAAFEAVVAAVERIGPRPPVSDLSAPEILDGVSRDKKARAGKVPFILPFGIGRVVTRDDVTPAEVRQALRAMAARERRSA